MLRTILGKKWLILLAIGVLPRLLLAPFTSHPYDFAVWVDIVQRYYSVDLNPFWHSKFGSFPIGLLMSGYSLFWILQSALSVSKILLLQFSIKLVYMLFDLGTGLLIYGILKTDDKTSKFAFLASLLWMLNPLAIFVTAIHGQTDSVPTFFTMLAVFCFMRQRHDLSILSLVAGASFLYYPIIGVPFLIPHARKLSPKRILLVIAGSSLILAANFGPFVYFGGGILSSLFSGLSSNVASQSLGQWSIWAPFLYDGNALVKVLSNWYSLVFACAYIVILTSYLFSHTKSTSRFTVGLASSVAIFLALYPNDLPQFFLWLLPLVIYLIFNRTNQVLIILSALCILVDFLVLFTYIDPQVYLLNSIPQIDGSSIVHWGLVNDRLSYTLGGVYGLLLLLLALAIIFPMKKYSFFSARQFVKTVKILIFLQLIVVAVFLGFVYSPYALAMYPNAPNSPVDLPSLNNIQFLPINQTITSEQNFDIASYTFAPNIISALTNRSFAFIDSNISLQLSNAVETNYSLSSTTALNAVKLNPRDSVDQIFYLNESSTGLSFTLLVGHYANVTSGLLISVYKMNNASINAGVQMFVTSVQQSKATQVDPGWYKYSFSTFGNYTAGSYYLELYSVTNSWWWNGGGHSFPSYFDNKSLNDSRWFEIQTLSSILITFEPPETTFPLLISQKNIEFAIPLSSSSKNITVQLTGPPEIVESIKPPTLIMTLQVSDRVLPGYTDDLVIFTIVFLLILAFTMVAPFYMLRKSNEEQPDLASYQKNM